MHISKSDLGSTSLVSYAARFRTIRPELLAGLERAWLDLTRIRTQFGKWTSPNHRHSRDVSKIKHVERGVITAVNHWTAKLIILLSPLDYVPHKTGFVYR